MKFSKVKPWIRNVFAFLSFLLLILIMISMIGVLAFLAINYLFIPIESEINIVFDKAYWINFLMDTSTCNNQVATGLESFSSYSILNPFNRDLEVESTSEPFNFKLLLRNGFATIQYWSSEQNDPVEKDYNIDKDGLLLDTSAEFASVHFTSEADLRLTMRICAHTLTYGPSNGTLLIWNNQLFPKTDSPSLIYIAQDYGDRKQITTLEFKNLVLNQKKYDKVNIIFESESDQSTLDLQSSGTNINYLVPSGVSQNESSHMQQREANAIQITLTNPVGTASLQYDGVFNLEEPISFLEDRILTVGHENGSGYVSLYLEAPFSNPEKLVLVGRTNNVIWQGTQKVMSRWQKLNVEMQVLIIGSILTTLGWLLTRLPTRRAVVSAGDVKFEIPGGYFIIMLSSGRMLAGELVGKPNWKSNKYKLRNVYIKEQGSPWQNSPITEEVSVKANQVEFIYVQK